MRHAYPLWGSSQQDGLRGYIKQPLKGGMRVRFPALHYLREIS
ncbi:hypothetical protein Nwat_0717 [Nitrosococcus watsonii C-113]|uniref:Uncharacterized protein n=1 Tax=Nitrosococcus watsoni (strain C-113) TaxID=105559 RepID=D8KBR2_NITWC|nr:hypothetical protein Nwat_0717 [Nitrosococcus watsonii C-113]